MCKKYGSYINDALLAVGLSEDAVFQIKDELDCFLGIDNFRIEDDGQVSCETRFSDGEVHERVNLCQLIEGYHVVFDMEWDW